MVHVFGDPLKGGLGNPPEQSSVGRTRGRTSCRLRGVLMVLRFQGLRVLCFWRGVEVEDMKLWDYRVLDAVEDKDLSPKSSPDPEPEEKIR